MMPRPRSETSAIACGTSLGLDHFRPSPVCARIPARPPRRRRVALPPWPVRPAYRLQPAQSGALHRCFRPHPHLRCRSTNFEGRSAVGPLARTVSKFDRIFQHILVGSGRPVELTIPSPTRDDRFFRRASGEPVEMRAHCDRALTFTPMPSLPHRRWSCVPSPHSGNRSFRVDTGAHRFEHGFARAFRGQNRASAVEIDEMPALSAAIKENDVIDIATHQVMRFGGSLGIDTGFDRSDAVIDDHPDRHFAEPHSDHLQRREHSRSAHGSSPKLKRMIQRMKAMTAMTAAPKINRVHGGGYGV